jgi:hypothetical protein
VVLRKDTEPINRLSASGRNVQNKFTSMKVAKQWFYPHPVRDEILPASTLAEELGKMAEHDAQAKYRLIDRYKTPHGVVKVYEQISLRTRPFPHRSYPDRR